MTVLIRPQRWKRPKMGVRIMLPTVFPRHRRYVKSFGCSVPGCQGRPIHFAHQRTAANSGKGTKPHDAFGIGYCAEHHSEAHAQGEGHMRKEYGIERWQLAAYFVRNSPDSQLRKSFDRLPPHLQGLLFEERLGGQVTMRCAEVEAV
jgi:hypothetical protein